jgi:hypothetical protein
VTREILDRLDVAVYGSLSVITTLEFFEHHFAKVGHRLAPYDPTLSLTPLLPTPGTRKRLPLSGFVQTGLEEMSNDLPEADFWPASLRVFGHNFRFALHS